MKKDKIEKAIETFSNKKILVLGDIMLDRYTFGQVSRISPEAPIPILKTTSETYVLGGSANVAHNIVSLGAQVILSGVIGSDHAGDVLSNLLQEKNIDTKLMIIDAKRPTTVKHRFVSENQQLLRVDREIEEPIAKKSEDQIIQKIEKIIKEVDGVILSDYAKGVFSERLAGEIIRQAKKHKKIIIADIKPIHKHYFKNVDILTPNVKEAKEMTQLIDINEVGKNLVSYFNAQIIITRGEDGLSIFRKDGTIVSFPSKKIEVFDVSGAGDTVVAVEMLGLAAGLSIEEAAYIANFSGNLVVQKHGTATLSQEELRTILYEENHIEAMQIVPKLWGYEKWIENNEKYCSKLLFLKKGYQCSLHYHKIKDEMFIITKGNVRLEVDKKIVWMRAGSFHRIPPNTPHRFRGIEDSMFIEVSTTHDDTDSYRIEESRRVRDDE